MNQPHRSSLHTRIAVGCQRASIALLLACTFVLPGCTVLAVADVAASAVVGTAGLVVDAAVGTARIGGKVIGKTADVMMGPDEVATAAD
ncbi:hypothetical protein [Hydrogenophaga sp.]|uniref:hypothetical protein n=1 Tax=Hydrogenophaga sp. TaxID=1904254 RepID=UPI0025BB15D5|nr:hypothetical protein [Hydrogenophaga sp.]